MAVIEKNLHMLKEVSDFVDLLTRGIEYGKDFDINLELTNKQLLVIGMGASGLVGDYLRAYFFHRDPELDVKVYKSHIMPKEKGLYVVYSYSGKTLETLDVFRKLLDKGIKNIIVVTSGGWIGKIARKNNLPVVELPGGYQSRSHVPYGIGALGVIVAKLLGKHNDVLSDFDMSITHLRSLLNEKEKLLADYIELGKKVVGKKVPVILGDVLIEPVPLRFRNQFSENSKVFSLSDVFPEIGHNLLCSMTKSPLVFPIIIERESADKVIKAYYEILKETLEEKDKLFIHIPDGKSFSWVTLLHPTLIADLMSIAFAEVNNVDAREIPEVKFVKKWLRKVIEVSE